jgi:3-oxoacyl-[acyl-carrier-protein] synthase II
LRREVVITGLGAVTPLGVGARPLYERWAAGESGIFDGAGACTDFEPKDFLTVKEIRRLDRFSQLALVACGEALEQAGWGEELPFDPMRIGCVIGTGIGGIETVETQHDVMRDRGSKMVSPLGIPQYMPNAAAAAVSMKHGLQGQMYGVVSACSGGAHAIGSALRMIQYGDADAVVTGGAEATLTAFGFACFNSMQALSPTGISRPFDALRDGFVMGEGAGVVVLEEYEHAKARGAKIYAELVGYGLSGDAHHITAPSEDGDGAFRCMNSAIKRAGITADDIDYINAHGTSTMADTIELGAVERVVGNAAAKISMSSTKSCIGHLLGAAGAVEAIFSMLAMRDQIAPPTINLDDPSVETPIDLVPHTARERKIDVVLSNSFGFGGTNASLVFRRAQA